MALLLFSQAISGALFLSFSATIFTNSLKALIPKYAPSVDPDIVINAGATGFQTLIQGEEMAGVLVAYAESVGRVLYLGTGLAVGCFIFGWFIGFKDIRKRKEITTA